jgi:disulfide bond formation protein DsbB
MFLAALKNHLNIRNLLLFSAVASALLLGAALVAQYGFNLHPCELCMKQRYPYVAIMAVGLLSAAIYRSKPAFLAAVLCVLLFLLDGGIAFYHTGVEFGWFPGPADCSNPATGDLTIEEMRRQIMEAPLVPCSQAMAYVFGLSLAAWNAIAAFSLAVLLTAGIYQVKKSSHV